MNIPFKSYATPDVLTEGDIVAMYAGNTEPSYVVTVDHVESDEFGHTITTTDGDSYPVHVGAQIWVAAWAPFERNASSPTTRAQRNASRFRPMGVR